MSGAIEIQNLKSRGTSTPSSLSPMDWDAADRFNRLPYCIEPSDIPNQALISIIP
jgi:hypothetical protein